VIDRNPCGSSSGSGVAPAANVCAASLGTETDGSIVCPATANDVVGLKPTDEEAIQAITDAGATVIDSADIPTIGQIGAGAEEILMLISSSSSRTT
jgi:amidase